MELAIESEGDFFADPRRSVLIDMNVAGEVGNPVAARPGGERRQNDGKQENRLPEPSQQWHAGCLHHPQGLTSDSIQSLPPGKCRCVQIWRLKTYCQNLSSKFDLHVLAIS